MTRGGNIQLADLVEVLGALMFGGDVLVAGLFLTAILSVALMGMISMANPPPIAYVMTAFLVILIAMSLGWLDYWLAILIGIVAAGAMAMKLGEGFKV